MVEGETDAPKPVWTASERFDARPSVPWLSPLELARAGVKAIVSKTFGDFSDRRELLAPLGPPLPPTVTPATELDLLGILEGAWTNDAVFWWDYVADLGDGFSATYSIAERLCAPSLKLGDATDPAGFTVPNDGELPSGTVLPAGQLLIMGGDQVYPAPVRRVQREAYWDRTVGPYRLASENADAGGPTSRSLYAIPGNHDWYDGLVSFLKQFCADRRIGAWQTRQKRSYFALPLPHHWWLWAIDIAFDGPMDDPQLEYFRQMAEKLTSKDAVVLCTAKPSWLGASMREDHDDYALLRQFVDTTLTGKQIAVPIMLSGDKHFYARHQHNNANDPVRVRVKIIAGGGGASLSTTQSVTELSIHESATDDCPREFELARLWPSRCRSWGAISASAFQRIPRTWSFCVLLTLLYLFVGYVVRSTADRPSLGLIRHVQEIGSDEWWDNFDHLRFEAMNRTAFWVVAAILLVIVGALAAKGGAKGWTLVVAPLHAALHIGGVLVVVASAMWFGAQHPKIGIWVGAGGAVAVALLTLFLNRQEIRGAKSTLLVAAAALVVLATAVMLVTQADPRDLTLSAYLFDVITLSYVISTILMVVYFYLVQLAKWNTTELSAGLRHEGWKHFLRIKVDADGVTIYTLGLEKVHRRRVKWTDAPGTRGGFNAAIRGRTARCELIDQVHVPHP